MANEHLLANINKNLEKLSCQWGKRKIIGKLLMESLMREKFVLFDAKNIDSPNREWKNKSF